MKEFAWRRCLNEGIPIKLVLKENEKDFIVREGINNSLLSIGNISNSNILLLDGLPGVQHKLLTDIYGIKERTVSIICRITGIQQKQDREEVHKIYSMHPFIYTKSVSVTPGHTDILVIFDTHHSMSTYAVTLTKKGRTTNDSVELLARLLRLESNQINYAGNKDKKAITTQRISVTGVPYLNIYKLANFINNNGITKSSNNGITKSSNITPEDISELLKIPDNDSVNKINSLFSGCTRDLHQDSLNGLSDLSGISTLPLSSIIQDIRRITTEYNNSTEPEQTDAQYKDITNSITEDTIILTNIERIPKKIQLGDLEKNRFYLRLEITDKIKNKEITEEITEEIKNKEITEEITDEIKNLEDRINLLKVEGFPNYYGNQRFGYGLSNPDVGELIIKKDFKGAISKIIENLGNLENSPRVKEALTYLHQEKYSDARNTLPGKFQTEKTVIYSLEKKIPAKIIFSRIRRETRMIYLHSYQSKLFNDVLQQRLINGVRNNEYITGVSIGSITSKQQIDQLVTVSDTPNISNTVIPLYPIEEIGASKHEKVVGLTGGYRKAIIIPENLNYSVINFRYLEISFDLPPGVYATMLIKELTCNGVVEIGW
ncbi:tRNA pseudouridine13 synthase [Nematocida parisii]|nr:tRNA pseudouridine13 synthase [Nematocida parisii]KAI5158155.1 tRNA pseudouridine13 synthase [Nematocida parisii]